MYYKNKSITIPESFEELSTKQFINLSELIYEGGNDVDCKVKAFRILSRVGKIRYLLMDPELISRAIDHIDWVFEGKTTIKQLIPIYRGYHGPASGFDNLKMVELHYSELYFNEIMLEENYESINKLVAVLYRKIRTTDSKGRPYDYRKNPDGDFREEFNDNLIDFNASIVKRWPEPVKKAIFLWYFSCRNQLIEDNPDVFNDPETGFESKYDTGLYGIIRRLAGEKLGSVSDVEQMYVHTCMLELGLIKEEERFMEEKIAEQKRKMK